MTILPSLRDSWIMYEKVVIDSICSPQINRDWFHKALPLAVLIKTWPKQEIKQMSLPNTPPGGTPYNGLYGEAPPERGTFFKLHLYKRVGISQVEVYKRVGKSII